VLADDRNAPDEPQQIGAEPIELELRDVAAGEHPEVDEERHRDGRARAPADHRVGLDVHDGWRLRHLSLSRVATQWHRDGSLGPREALRSCVRAYAGKKPVGPDGCIGANRYVS
jgi:hypothetical protein